MNEKAFAIAHALAKYYGIPEPEFDSVQECHQWVKSILSKSNAQLKRCPYCQTVLMRKLKGGRLKYLCKNCNKTYDIKHFS